jgi:hypothetical protein
LEIMEGAILFQQASTSNASINGWFSWERFWER